MKGRLSVVILACSLATGRAAADDKFSFRGYIKNYSMVFRLPEPENRNSAPRQPLLGMSISRLRSNLSYAPAKILSLQMAYDFSPRIQDPIFFRTSPFGFTIDPTGYRVADFRNPIVPGPGEPKASFGLYHNLDRLSAMVKMKIGDLIIGRQPIAWGSARVVNPTDIIAPFSFNEPDKEERYGVDAVRLRVPLGRLSELDMGYVLGRKFAFSQSAFFVRSKFHVAKTDLALLLLGFRRDLLLGIDVARSLGGAGAWFEGAYAVPGVFDRDSNPADSEYVRLSTGIDGSLNTNTYAFLEYHFNSAGASQPEFYPGLLCKPAYSRGSTYLLGRHYVAAGLNYQLTPLIQVTGMFITNVLDRSLSLSPQVEYNVSKNIYLAGGAYLGIGKGPGAPLLTDPPVPADLKSEFGGYPDYAFLSFRLYF
jgi:hypothetical protein